MPCASAKNSSKLNKFLQSEVNLLIHIIIIIIIIITIIIYPIIFKYRIVFPKRLSFFSVLWYR